LSTKSALNEGFWHGRLEEWLLKIQPCSATIWNLKDYCYYTLKMLGCFNPTVGEIWTNPNVIKKINPMARFVHIW